MKLVFTSIFFASCLFFVSAQTLDEKILEGFNIRNIGPAGMSGRITAIDVVLSDPDHIYIGAASGGVWESTDGGIDWKPIFDDQPALAIGAIKINQQNPNEIWVGTGEGNPRNSQNSGKGIFRSLDGGRTWKHMGLTETKVIHRILIDFHNPSTIYVGAGGSPWGPNPERGVFKSTDSGKTWNKILYSNDKSGIADLVMDPANPRKMVAALYEHMRTPWDFYSGGGGSGLHITYDGGENWKKITSAEGLPKGHLGRIGLAIAPSKPNIIYALIEAKENGLYKSTDGGEHWSLVSTKNIGNRPFYYHELYVDSKNENRIWNLYSYVSKSEDGGKTFETILDYGKSVHPDHHAFWIHPDDPTYMIDGNDGGLNISRDGGRNWYFCGNIPVGQFYHIDVDNEYPYHIYGGMQDNGSWVGPAFVLKAGGIRNQDWRELYFGDGFDVLPKLSDTRYGWAMSQGGNLAYYDRETGFNQFVKPVHPDGIDLRYNWNAAIASVPRQDCGIYYGSQFVHRSLDCGHTWEIISPDLTTNDTTKQKQNKSGGLTIDATQAENHTTILCIAPSSIDPDVMWVGTDDGNLQLTRDGGKNWTNLISKINGCPAGAWIPQIEVSSHNAGEAFVVVNNYRRNDWKAYTFHTTDYGATWKKIVNDQQVTSFVQCITQDPVVPSLLFLGADDGLYISTDSGANWSRFPSKVFPRVSTMDLKIHPTDHSLAIGTFGRALWVLDNLQPLREIARNRSVMEKPFLMFTPVDAVQAQYRSVDGIRFTADAEFRGANRGGGARIPLYVKPAEKIEPAKEATSEPVKEKGKKKQFEKSEEAKPIAAAIDTVKKKEETKDKDILKVYVLDSSGDTIRYINQKIKEGWNTFGWDMRKKGVRYPSRNEPPKDADDPSGEYVVPGSYKLVGLYNGQKDSTMVQVKLDPRLNITASDLEARNKMIVSFYKEVDVANKAFRALQDVRKDVRMIEAMMANAPDSTQTKIKDKTKELLKKISDLEKKFMEPEDAKGFTNENNLGRSLGNTNSYLNTSLGEPGANARDMLSQTKTEVEKIVTEVDSFLKEDWKAFKTLISEMEWPMFKTIEALK
jgi:photosystem II stability/assembly factor-like uncharacterized protein